MASAGTGLWGVTLDEDEFAHYVELGRGNARMIELATNHCQNVRFVECGGQGMLEESTGLPLNMRRVECTVAIGNTAGMRIDGIALDFFAEHCPGCPERNPTGQLPNLETEFQKRQEAAAASEAEAAEVKRKLSIARAARVERRRSLRASADPAAANILDDLDMIDADPEAGSDSDQQRKAGQRLTAVAGRAHDRFSLGIIDELFDAVATVGSVELLEPLRHLTAKSPELADRLVATAVTVLKERASLEAGRCLSDHPARVTADMVDEALIRSAAVLAGSKTPDDHRFSGPSPVVTANDPEPIRVLADVAPDAVVRTLAAMLPHPEVKGFILPSTVRRPRASDFDRQAAAGTIDHLASTHLDLAVSLLPSLAISLGVAPADRYDTGTLGSAERALGRILIEDPARVVSMFERAGRHGSGDIRKGLIGAARRAVDMVDPENRFRRAQDPRLDEPAAQSVVDAAFPFLIARTDETWGSDATFEAAEAIENIGRRLGETLQPHIDTTLGAFITLTRHRLETPQRTLISTGPEDPLAHLEALGRSHSLYQASRRLLSAVEEAAATDPVGICGTICTLITNERDCNFGVEVITPLLETLGNIGSRLGSQPGVLQAILPTLHTYLVDAEPGPRGYALKAWTDVGSRHPVPSTVSDLLPALVTDPYVVVIQAVLAAATRLTWTKREDRGRLALYASSLVATLELPERVELLLTALAAVRRHVSSLDALNKVEKHALARLPTLEWHLASKVIEQPWQPNARVSPELARLWLAYAPQRTYGLRQGDEAEEALNGLLDCSIGLLGLPAADIIAIGSRHSPESHYGSAEYAEVLARAERRSDVVELLKAALGRIPDNRANASKRAFLSLALATARLHTALAAFEVTGMPTSDPAPVQTAVDGIAAAVELSQPLTSDDKKWLKRFEHAAATRAAISCDLLNLPYPDVIAAALTRSGHELISARAAADPADDLRRRAQNLRRHSKSLSKARRSTGTATHRGVSVTSRLLDCAAHLLDAEAAELNADLAQARAHRSAAQRRAAAIDLTSFRPDDPLLARARELHAILSATNERLDVTGIANQAARLPTPLLFIRSADQGRSHGRSWHPQPDPQPDSPNIAVTLVSIDDRLLTGPAVVDPTLTHTITLQVQTDPWPAWATRLDAELVSTLNHQELERPTLSWQRNQHTADQHTFEGTGSLHVRYSVPATQQAPPVLVRLSWRGVDPEGNPLSQELDVAGHREFRVRPFDPARDATTQYEVFDEHLLAIYENLAGAGYPHNQLEAFARLLNAISRIGLAMTWNKKYRRGQYVKERDFHNDLHNALLADPTLEGRVERGTPLALGYLDTRHDGITAELKVARDQPVTPETAVKYIGQPTQYAAADGTRLSILVILDMSRKTLPIGTPENYLFVLNPQQHGMTEPHSPSVVVTLVINGNLPVPSSWSRRKTPTRER
ncbi:hypothetical protein GCM10022275_31530 [Tessaracoccus defluvii]